jgi:hypothetical protein
MLLGVEISDSLSVGELVVGVGTILLAGFTAWLGFSTRSSAKAGQEAVEASEEPYVIAVPSPGQALTRREDRVVPIEIHRWPLVTEPERWVLRCGLWNIGAGPAIVHDVRLRSHDESLIEGFNRHVAIAAREASDVQIASPRWRDRGAGTLQIEYTHSNGHRYVTTSDVALDGDELRCLTFPRQRE